MPLSEEIKTHLQVNSSTWVPADFLNSWIWFLYIDINTTLTPEQIESRLPKKLSPTTYYQEVENDTRKKYLEIFFETSALEVLTKIDHINKATEKWRIYLQKILEAHSGIISKPNKTEFEQWCTDYIEACGNVFTLTTGNEMWERYNKRNYTNVCNKLINVLYPNPT